MVWSFLATKWPILVPFCGMDHRKSNFSLIFSIFSVRGCWGQPMLLFWIFFDETQMVDSREHANHHKCFLMYLKPTVIMILYLTFCTETPCTKNQIYVYPTSYPIMSTNLFTLQIRWPLSYLEWEKKKINIWAILRSPFPKLTSYTVEFSHPIMLWSQTGSSLGVGKDFIKWCCHDMEGAESITGGRRYPKNLGIY